MARDPAMLFYTKDFLTGVALLNMKERGQYITLLCLQQQLGHMSLERMQQAVGKLSPAVLEKYVQDEDGLYYNERAELEINKRKAHCEKQKATAEKRWNKDTTAIPDECHGISHGIAMAMPLANASIRESLSTEKDGLEVQSERDIQFESFWSVYPRKVGKVAAKKAFAKIPKSVWPKLVPAVEVQKQSYQWSRDGGQYIPYPATWLTQGRWDDEVDQARPSPANKKVVTASEYTAPTGKIDFEALKKAVQGIEGPS